MHSVFLQAAKWRLLPLDTTPLGDEVKTTSKRKFFQTNFGVKGGFCKEGGEEVDGLFDTSSSLGFVELGPCTIDP